MWCIASVIHILGICKFFVNTFFLPAVEIKKKSGIRLHYIVCLLYNKKMSKEKKDTQINIRISSELLETLKKQAEAEVTTTSQLVRKAVTFYVRDRNNSV